MREGDLDRIADGIAKAQRTRTEKYWRSLAAKLADLTADSTDSDGVLDRYWFLWTLTDVHNRYVGCVSDVRLGKYYDAWCALERIEIAAADLTTNMVYPILREKVAYIARTIAKWQTLFPYAVFLSPEYVARRSECTICGGTNTPWTSCGHERGKLYRGRVAHRRIVEAELLGISFVTTPVQKYSVAFAQGEDKLNYEVLKFVVDRLASPFDDWRSHKTVAYRPHHLFAGRPTSDPCPCGSGRPYEKCCLQSPGVVGPHMQIEFEKAPPTNLPSFVLPRELRHDEHGNA